MERDPTTVRPAQSQAETALFVTNPVALRRLAGWRVNCLIVFDRQLNILPMIHIANQRHRERATSSILPTNHRTLTDHPA